MRLMKLKISSKSINNSDDYLLVNNNRILSSISEEINEQNYIGKKDILEIIDSMSLLNALNNDYNDNYMNIIGKEIDKLKTKDNLDDLDLLKRIKEEKLIFENNMEDICNNGTESKHLNNITNTILNDNADEQKYIVWTVNYLNKYRSKLSLIEEKVYNAFKNLSFKIPSGKVVAFVGYSGSGKTTITSLIQRFYDPNNGEIKINDINLKDLDLKWLRKNIGIVSQEPILNSCSIKDNIIYGVDSYSNELFKKVCEQSKVSDFVEDKNQFPLSYDTICGERGAVLSGGQKQRIAIARALIKNSKILIFDEATSALDAENECVVQNSINDIVKENKVTTIIIAHRLSTVKSADCIYVLDKGKICEFGTHDELIEKNGIYKQLIQNQI